jgi:hypothetical protein
MNHTSRAGIRAIFCCALSIALAAPLSSAGAGMRSLSAAQVVARNVAVRGGVAAWRAIRSVSLTGQMDLGRLHPPPDAAESYATAQSDSRQRPPDTAREAPSGQRGTLRLPFRLEMKRPHMSRLELYFAGHTAIQVYDGNAGWKLRPFAGHAGAESFSPAEMKIASSQQELDGLLIDAAAKGNRISLEGMDNVNGVPNYRLKVVLRTGEMRRVWLDAATFLETKVDGIRELGGRPFGMTTLLSDYRLVDNVMMPFVMETFVPELAESEKIMIDKVSINADLPDTLFTMR